MVDVEGEIENLDDVMKSLVVPADPDTGEPLPEKVKPATNGQAQVETETIADEKPPVEPADGPDAAPVEEPTQEEQDDYSDIDVDEIPLEVMVDGQLQQVTIKELKSKFSMVGAIDKRLQEVTEGRNVLQQQANRLDQVYGHTLNKLQALDTILAQAEQPTVDMDELRVKDPTRYLFERERIREAQDRRGQVRAEAARIAQQQEEVRQAALVEYSKNEARVLGQIDPEFADPVKAPQAMKRLSEGAAHYKYTPQEVYSVTDHRALLVLKDALAYRELMAKQQSATHEARTAPRQLLKPGAKKAAPQTQAARQMKALQAKARTTGKADDVAATLIVRAKR